MVRETQVGRERERERERDIYKLLQGCNDEMKENEIERKWQGVCKNLMNF